MSTEEIITGLASVLVIGVLAQWVAWRFRIPSILLLLLAGLLVGPVLGLLNPDDLLGDVLIPFVSISVAIILYEGGLSLNFRELRGLRGPVLGLVSVGAIATWFLIALAARQILGLDSSIAALLGAILVVSGPTVVQPLLLHIRPTENVGSVLKWEGVFIDPLGAIAAIITVHAITAGDIGTSRFDVDVLTGFITTLTVGAVIGALAALGLTILMKNFQVPDYLLNSVSLAMVVGFFAISDGLREESGLFAVTVMGVVLANQRWVSIDKITEFKENLRVLIISVLFILLAARLQSGQIEEALDWSAFVFLGLIVLLFRPFATFLATLRSALDWRERAFVASMAPRGIVAASIASIYGLDLEQKGVDDADLLVPFTFFIIIGTVVIYSLSSGWAAALLGVKGPDPRGILFLGINDVSWELASSLQAQEVPVLLVDTNETATQRARLGGLPTFHGDLLVEDTLYNLDLDGLGKLAAMMADDDVNSLAILNLHTVFDSRDLYRVAPDPVDHPALEEHADHKLPGRIIANNEATLERMEHRLEDGATIRSTGLTSEFSFDDYKQQYGNRATPIFLVPPSGSVQVFSADHSLVPKSGDTVVGLIDDTDPTTVADDDDDPDDISSFGEWQQSLDERDDIGPEEEG